MDTIKKRTEKRRINKNANSLNLFERGTLIELSNGKTVPIEAIRENDFLICEKSLYTPVTHCMFSNISNLSSIGASNVCGNNVKSDENDVADAKLSDANVSRLGDKSVNKPYSCTFKTLTSLTIRNKYHRDNVNSENASHSRINKMLTNLKLTSCVVVSYEVADDNASIEFSIDELKTNITMMNVPIEMPLFVRKKGWTSIDPNKTLMRYNLHCSKLDEKDQCMILLDNNGGSSLDYPKMKQHNRLSDENVKGELSENEEYEQTLVIDDSAKSKAEDDVRMTASKNLMMAETKATRKINSLKEASDDEGDEKLSKSKRIKGDFKRVDSDANGDDNLVVKNENNV